ncbi:phosphotransferase [Bacillus sp. Cr_A10]|uniref:aminoglycoside phosphotransferase family protein n=1 Tax=Bacillus sp. Cr_A10 TaxID=3033993 RepID=UPI0023D97AAC|nr:phosphotransferase [Bacillus sp. Cr_A10]MDF2066689.1 phosphotransferase [Bacillus sp. Cr_A10]
MEDNIPILMDKIEVLRNSTMVTMLSKGYSLDKKYVVIDKDENKYLLRISDMERYDRKKEEFQILSDIKKYKVHSPQPIDFGILKDLGICYSIFSFIEGEDAKNSIRSFTEQEQYEIGIEAGKDLSQIHLHPAPFSIKHWHIRAIQKHNRYLEEYKKCGIKIINDDKVLSFIESNYHYLNKRPSQLQHDDFHLENIILKNKKYVGVIDFDNYDWGDPFHDFVKVALASRVDSISYSIGQIDGYFTNNIPEDFWRLYSIYSAMVIFSSVVWSIKKSPEQLDKFIERIHLILEDHKNFEVLKPIWYK